MADKLRKTIPLKITFGDGEQPTSTKLNTMADQVRNGNAIIEKAIGDLWNHSGDASLTDNPLQIPNLARLIGANEYLNPALYPGTTSFDYEESIGVKYDNLTMGKLLFKPNSTTVTITNPNGNFSSLVSNEHDVITPGEYWIDTETGKFRVYNPLQGNEKIRYTVDPTDVSDGWVVGAETLPGIIPDPGQTTFTSCRVSENGGQYYLHLPPRQPLSLSDREKPVRYPATVDLADNTNGTTTSPLRYWQDAITALTGGNSDHYRYQLPREIQDTVPQIAVGEDFPTGFFYLWDQNTNTIIEDVVFRRADSSAISPALEDYVVEIFSNTVNFSSYVTTGETEADYSGTGLTLITCGAPVTRTLWSLVASFYKHSHKNDGVLDSNIRHSDLINQNPPSSAYSINGHNIRYPSNIPDFTSSRWAYDDHVSLLSRSGSHGVGTVHRDVNDNAMLGDFVLASTVDSGNGVYLNNSGDSNRLYFGQHGSSSVYGNSNQDIVLAPTGDVRITMPTEDISFVDAGSVAATEQDWIEVTVNGITGYIRVFSSK